MGETTTRIETGHTPGPWVFLEGGGGGDSSVGVEPDPDVIAHCYDPERNAHVLIATLSSPSYWNAKTGYHKVGSATANGPLLAAAPDMLAVLQAAEWNVRHTPFRHCPICNNTSEQGHEPDCSLAAAIAKATATDTPTPAPPSPLTTPPHPHTQD